MTGRVRSVLIVAGMLLCLAASSPATPGVAHPKATPGLITTPAGLHFDGHGGRVDVEIDMENFVAGPEGLSGWLEIALASLDAYFGELPFDRMQLQVELFDGCGVRR